MLLRILVVAALAAAVTALPREVDDVPPTVEVQAGSAMADSFNQAKSLMQEQGTDACKDLADATEKAVKDNVAAEQSTLNGIDKGANCPDAGQDGVTAANKLKSDADEAVNKAQAAYNDAQNADVDWGSSKFSSVTKGSCGQFFESTAWKEAEAKVNDAKKKLDEAKGAQTNAAKEVTEATKAAEEAVKKCKCDAYKAHESALAAANAKIESANKNAWTKAAHLKCVVAGTSLQGCTVPPLPKVNAVTLAAGVDDKACGPTDHGTAEYHLEGSCGSGHQKYSFQFTTYLGSWPGRSAFDKCQHGGYVRLCDHHTSYKQDGCHSLSGCGGGWWHNGGWVGKIWPGKSDLWYKYNIGKTCAVRSDGGQGAACMGDTGKPSNGGNWATSLGYQNFRVVCIKPI